MDTVNISEETANLNLTDLIDLDTLRLIQDSFSGMTGIASLITDKDGIAITGVRIFRIFVPNMSVPQK